ncbi:MAG: GTP-binding protein [Acidimicrobiales bacterium]
MATLLRFATIGSVDDGKSTLIGRLLYDAKGLFDDQVEAVAATTARRGGDGLDLSLVTDGLRAEREQGITIDVAYRYFATRHRSFIIGDNPGHAQYTRNMATGASTADLAVVLVDARTGLLEQTRRHLAVAALLGIRDLVLAVNKMDLVAWSPDVFDAVVTETLEYAGRLGITKLVAIPISALYGDNVVERSMESPWYGGPTLLTHLEEVEPYPGDDSAFRMPVQLVIRTESEGRPVRRYAGLVVGGRAEVGDAVQIWPAGTRTTIAGIEIGTEAPEAVTGSSVVVRLEDELDVTRGDLLASVDEPPTATRELEAAVCWFGAKPLLPGARVLVKHTTRTERAVVRAVLGRRDLDSLEETPAGELARNDIGTVRLALAGPLVVDLYADNRATGGFIVIDEGTDETLAAGMITAV